MLSRLQRPTPPRIPLFTELWPLAVRIVLLVTAILIGVWLLVTLSGIFVLLLFAVTLAAGVSPLIDGLQRRGLRRGLAVLLMYLVLVGALAVLGLVLIPLAVRGVRESVARAPEYAERFTRWLTDLQQAYPALAAVLDPTQIPLRDAADAFTSQIGAVVSQAVRLGGLALGLVEAVVVTVVLLAVTFYLLVDGRRVRDYLLSFVPAARRPRAQALAGQIGPRMGGWVLGQLILSTGVGLATFIGLCSAFPERPSWRLSPRSGRSSRSPVPSSAPYPP